MASSPAADDPVVAIDKVKSDKKRKRAEKELRSKKEKSSEKDENDSPVVEVDLSLPAPLSKKQKRLQKKGKLDENGEEIKPKSSKSSSRKTDNDDDLTGNNDNDDGNNNDDDGKQDRSEFGIWIGNLPWSATKVTLRRFLLDRLGVVEPDDLPASQSVIRRIHLPTPHKTELAAIPAGRFRPSNKGFAYVDFATARHMTDALMVTESDFNRRRVLIKPAANFEGRPDVSTAPGPAVSSAGADGDATAHQPGFTGAIAKLNPNAKPPNKRVFIGNLGFDATRADLEGLYAVCGPIALTHLATFEDSGKCKGYGWITFEDLDSSSNAVRGWVHVPDEEEELDRMIDGDKPDDKTSKSRSKPRMRKQWANRLHGRQLRCEFAEDADVRYAKRFGKDAKKAASKAKMEAVVAAGMPGLPASITGAIVKATGKRMMFAD